MPDHDSETGKDERSRSVRFLSAAAGLGVFGALIFVLWGEAAWFANLDRTGPLAEFLSLGEIAAQVRVPFGQALVVSVPVLLLLRFRKCVWGASVIAAYCLSPLFILSFGSPLEYRPRGKYVIHFIEPQPFTCMAANLLWTNPRKDEVLAMIRRESPDIVGLSEVSKAWRDAALQELGDLYPYSASGSNLGEWTEEAWGEMLLSKVPIDSVHSPELVIDGQRMRPFVEASIGGISVTVLHPERPGRAWRLRARTSLFEQVAEREPDGPRIVMGDFNTTTSSPVMRRFLRRTGLQDSRLGFGRQPSWNHFPGQVPAVISGSLARVWKPGVAIDHVLVSETFSVLERRMVSIPGSDHLAVVVTMEW